MTVGELRELLDDYGDHLDVIARQDNEDHMLVYEFEVTDGIHGPDRDLVVILDLDQPTKTY